MNLCKVATILGMFALGGCAQLGQAKEKAAEAADAALSLSHWQQCYASSVGAVKRKYGGNPTLMNAYNTLCDEGHFFVIEPDEPVEVSDD